MAIIIKIIIQLHLIVLVKVYKNGSQFDGGYKDTSGQGTWERDLVK